MRERVKEREIEREISEQTYNISILQYYKYDISSLHVSGLASNETGHTITILSSIIMVFYWCVHVEIAICRQLKASFKFW